MKTPIIKIRILLASLFLAVASAGAEDIDIYAAPPPDGARPNVLIIMDNAASNNANFNSRCDVGPPLATNPVKLLEMVQCGIYAAIKALGTESSLKDRLNVGLLQYGDGSNAGGKWWAPAFAAGSGPDTLPFMDSTGVTNHLALIGAPVPTSNNRAAPSVMQEAWAFFNGKKGRSEKTYAGYGTGTCAKNFIIFLGAAAKQGGPATGINANPTLAEGTYGEATAAQDVQISTTYLGANTGDDFARTDEWARFIRTCQPQSARTYTIAVTGADRAENYIQHLRSMAKEGGGKPFVASSSDEIKQALLQIFNEVQAVNSVFASSSLPVSVNAQGTFLNQIFMGMFRPDPAGAPRWFGNLKQFQFGVDTSNPASPKLFLADSTGAQALSAAGTGFISSNAVSFWTKKDISTAPDSTGGYFINNPLGASSTFDSPDGEVVEKGGAGQQIRLANLINNYTTDPASPRRLYTCTGSCAGGSSLSGTPFATTNANITQAQLGTGTPGTSITKIERNSTTDRALVTLATTPNPLLTSGSTVSITGSSRVGFNGTYSATVLTDTTFTYPIQENPPRTALNTYTASVPGTGGIAAVTSLTRVGTVVTARAPAHGFSTGNSVEIAGASAGYNGGVIVTRIDADTFRYTLPGAESPTTPGGGGTATAGGGTFSIESATANPNPGFVRGPSNSSSVAVVTVCTTASHGYSTGNTVTIVGATPNDYNGSWGKLAPADASLNPGGITKTSNRCFTFNIRTRPVSPATGSSITADGSATRREVSSLTRIATNCPTSTTATATVTTSLAHPFVVGNTVSIAVKAGTTPTTGEGGYVGSFTILTTPTSTTFTYLIPEVTPACVSTGGTVSLAGVVDRETLIRWVRGEDNFADEPSPGGAINIRPSIHGDVLHSRPTVINYGGTKGVVVFYGSNDGIFRAVNGNNGLFKGTDGNLVTNIGSVAPGGELWGFVPTEFYSKLYRLRQNTPIVKFASTATTIIPAPIPKDYFFDGPTGVYQEGDKAYIYMAARRGGRILYAIDVSDPADPKLLWKKTTTDLGTELGQTWSQPTVVRVRGYVNPVLIFGAGYDPNQDSEPPGADTMGRGIFILDAVTGALLWRAGPGGGSNTCTVTAATAATTGCQLQKMVYSIPADISPIDRNFDGCIDRVYAADTGGNIWRVDLQAKVTDETGKCGDGIALTGAKPQDWQVTLFAELGGSGATKRKFFFPPDVVTTKTFDAVLATTGDREHPLRTVSGTTPIGAYSIYNKFYMIKDRLIGNDGSTGTSITDTTRGTDNSVDSANFFDATSAPYTGVLNGFAVKLGNIGEKGVNAPATVGGFTFFGTNQPVVPPVGSCEPNLGTARGYRVNFLSGASSNVIFDGGGLPPSPVSGLVEVNINGEKRLLPFIIGGGNPDADCVGPDCTSALGGRDIEPVISGVRRRTFWYQERDK